jgi:hypothetical protein
MNASNISTSKFIKESFMSLKEQVRPDIIIMGALNTQLSSTNHSDKKINKDILELNNIVDEMDLINIYRVFHPMAAY